MHARSILFSLLLGCNLTALADEPGYQLSMESSVNDGRLTVAPRINAPAGKRLRYELASTKQGAAGKSSTSQSGSVVADAHGMASLSMLRLSVAPGDRYSIVMKVFEGQKLVAEQMLQYP